MKPFSLYPSGEEFLSPEEIRAAIADAAAEYAGSGKKILLVVPDYTRYHSNAGLIANTLWHCLTGCRVELLQALGTHVPMTREEIAQMYGDIPFGAFIPHDWRNDVVKLGEVPGELVSELSEGLMTAPIDVELNRRVTEGGYDCILSIGQVVPHEVVGMANQAKNLFVGVGGSSMINASHMLGAFYGMERVMGKDHSPVRKVFDYALETFLKDLPLHFILTVCTAPGGNIRTHGLFVGRERKFFEEAVALAQQKNLTLVDAPMEKVVVYLNPEEFKSTWLGNKAIYRTRMAIADGGELLILAPGVDKFGEDAAVDKLIRKYGYRGRLHTLEVFKSPEAEDLRANMGAAAHLIHGSSDGRFTITYCVKNITKEEVEGVGFKAADYDETIKKYDPEKLQYGYNTVDGEEIYFIPNPALGLWINREKFNA